MTTPDRDVAAEVHGRLSADLRTAMRARDRVRVRVVRDLMSAIDQAGAVPVDTPRSSTDPPLVGLGAGEVPRRRLDLAAVTALLDDDRRERREAAARLRDVGRPDAAAALDAEAAIVDDHLDALA